MFPKFHLLQLMFSYIILECIVLMDETVCHCFLFSIRIFFNSCRVVRSSFPQSPIPLLFPYYSPIIPLYPPFTLSYYSLMLSPAFSSS